MVKIEVEVKDKPNDQCEVTIRKPKPSKNASVTEMKTANAIKLTIDKSIENLSK